MLVARYLAVAAFAYVLAFSCTPILAREDAKAADLGFPGPTEEHKLVQQDVGEWNAVAKFWMSSEGEPMESEATEVVKPLGEFWVLSEFKGDFGGAAFTGHGQYGYDPVKKKYIGTWTDTLSPHLSTMEGNIDEETGKLVMIATGIDAQSGEPSKMKNVSWQTEEGGRVFEMHLPTPGEPGKWWKMMEITYTRK